MSLQSRLNKIMRRRNMRVADLARELDKPYTTVREWVLYGREPGANKRMAKRLAALEKP